jgi:hypothetical protein
VLGVAFAAAAALYCGQPGHAAAHPPGPKVFVLGVWAQPAELMGVWKGRGLNTVAEPPEGHDLVRWSQAAGAKALFQLRHPQPDIAADMRDPYLRAWATLDEPSDTHDGVLAPGHVRADPAAVAQEAAPWRAAAQAAGCTIPVWTNHVGSHIAPDWAQANTLMHAYMEGPASDWLAADSYPIERGEPFVVATNDGYASTTQGVIIDRQIAWSGGKPVMAFIGTSAFKAGGGAPTPAQFDAMAWSIVIHGASGVLYFPIQFSPRFSFDATAPDVAQAMERFDRQVAKLGDILMDPVNGGRRPFEVFRSAKAGAAPGQGQLPYPFEAAEIATPRGPFRIVLNLSDQDQAFQRPAWGVSGASFGPYEVRMGFGADLRPPR